jgi:hypothetical protein
VSSQVREVPAVWARSGNPPSVGVSGIQDEQPSRWGCRQPPHRLAGHSQPGRELRRGQEVRGLARGDGLGPAAWRDERRRQGPGHFLQQLGRDCGDRGSPIMLGICRASLHGGSCRRGLAPWVILADGPGGLAVPGSAFAECRAGASGMVRRFALAHRAAMSASRGAGPTAVPGIAADLRARIPGVPRERQPTCPALSERAQRYEVNRDTLARRPG